VLDADDVRQRPSQRPFAFRCAVQVIIVEPHERREQIPARHLRGRQRQLRLRRPETEVVEESGNLQRVLFFVIGVSQ
jgi:hypothetical protein